jgi:hypothetical protein
MLDVNIAAVPTHREASAWPRRRRPGARSYCSALLCGCALLIAASSASAQAESAPPAARDDSEWYGWQTLSLDVASLAFIAGGGAAESAGPALIGLAGLLLATPITHALHRNPWALPSLGLRAASIALVLVGGVVAVASCFTLGEEPKSACSGGRTAGTVIAAIGGAGMLGSIAADAVLARSRPVARAGASLGLWGDPLAGIAGISLTVVR